MDWIRLENLRIFCTVLTFLNVLLLFWPQLVLLLVSLGFHIRQSKFVGNRYQSSSINATYRTVLDWLSLGYGLPCTYFRSFGPTVHSGSTILDSHSYWSSPLVQSSITLWIGTPGCECVLSPPPVQTNRNCRVNFVQMSFSVTVGMARQPRRKTRNRLAIGSRTPCQHVMSAPHHRGCTPLLAGFAFDEP